MLESLFRAEVRGLTLSRAQGHGGETERVENYRGTTVKMELSEKVRLEIGVSDHFVEPTVRAILSSASTGEVGDGKVFVLPVECVYRIAPARRTRPPSRRSWPKRWPEPSSRRPVRHQHGARDDPTSASCHTPARVPVHEEALRFDSAVGVFLTSTSGEPAAQRAGAAAAGRGSRGRPRSPPG